MSESGERLAPLIPFRRNERNDLETLEPGELTDEESISLALSTWRHPSLPAREVARHISNLDIPGRDDAWAERLKNAMMNINVPDEVYDQLLHDTETHHTFAQMQKFLRVTQDKSNQEKLADERRATLRLMDMYELAASLELAPDPHESHLLSTHDVSEVFEKMTRSLDEASHAG